MKQKYSLLGQEDFELTGGGTNTAPTSSGLEALTDLFSNFTKHISPAPSHERPERSVQMRLYTMQKRHFLICFTIFFCLFLISVLIGMASPNMVEKNTVKATELNGTAAIIPKGPFVMKSPRLSRYNQQLWLMVKFLIKNNDETFTKNFTMMLSVIGLNKDLKKGEIIGLRKHNRTRSLDCSGTTCKTIIAMHLGYLPDSMYLINASFLGFEHYSYTIQDLLFTWATYNPAFTELEVVFRFLFFVLTFAVLIFFGGNLRKYPIQDWSMEQRWICMLLVLLIFYNNPLFPLTLTSSTLFAGILDAIFQSTFLFALLAFWLCTLHGLRQTRRTWKFFLPKFLIVFPMWLSALTMEITQEFNEVRDPTFSFQINTAHYKRFQVLFFCLLFIYIGYIVFLIVKAFTELRSMQFIQTRLKFITCFMGIIISLCISIVYTKFGFGVLEDNFISRFYTSYDSVTQFLSFYALLNLYMYMMVYVYSPCGGKEVSGMALSDTVMMGDSDEEVLYGDSEVRKPLNSHDDEESD